MSPDWDRSIDDYKFGPDNRTLYVTAQDVGQKGISRLTQTLVK